MTFVCPHCGTDKSTLNGLCSHCMKFSSLVQPEPSGEARKAAFDILRKHPGCLRQDVVLNDLIDEIAIALDGHAHR